MRCGDTLLIPAPGMGVTPHLWIIATEPVTDTQLCVIVNVTTLRNSRDQTVMLRKGDHPFITHDSAIFYGDGCADCGRTPTARRCCGSYRAAARTLFA